MQCSIEVKGSRGPSPFNKVNQNILGGLSSGTTARSTGDK